MRLEFHEHNGQRIGEAAADSPSLGAEFSAMDLVEVCFNNRVKRVLLSASNLGSTFFDLKSRMAGEALEKWRQYRLRVAVVLPPDTETSTKFRELMTEENKRSYIHFCATRNEALDWLAGTCSDAEPPRQS
jgi:hypothetical protein